MNFYQNNLKVLKEKYPELALLVEKTDFDKNTLIPTQDGLVDLKINDSVKYDSNPSLWAEKSFLSLHTVYPKMVAIYGIGLGYHIKKFFENISDLTRDVLLVEKSVPLFKASLHVIDWTQILKDKRFTLFVNQELEGLQYQLNEYFAVNTRYMVAKTLSNMFDLKIEKTDQSYYLNFAKAITECLKLIDRSHLAPDDDSYAGFTNIIKNLENCAEIPFIDGLKDSFKGFPGIVIAAGPSLNYSLEWLKSVNDRAVLFCADAVLSLLQKNGIRPHFVGCIERHTNTPKLFQEVKDAQDTYFVTMPLVWHETYKMYPGPKIHMLTYCAQLPWFFPKTEKFSIGHSVSHQMFEALHFMGCTPIMFVGQDLAYDRNSTRSHVSGVPDYVYTHGQKQRDEYLEKVKENKEYLVEGNNGEPILTNRFWNAFRKEMELLVYRAKTNCLNVIPKNCGSKILHATQIEPEKAVDYLGQCLPIRQIIKKGLNKSQGLKGKAFKNDIVLKMKKAIDNLKTYEDVCFEVLDVVSHYLHVNNPNVIKDEKVFHPLFKRIEIITSELFHEDDDFFHGFFHGMVVTRLFAICKVSQEIMAGRLEPEKKLGAQITTIYELFNTVILWSGRMRRYLQKTLAQSHFYQDEYNESVNP